MPIEPTIHRALASVSSTPPVRAVRRIPGHRLLPAAGARIAYCRLARRHLGATYDADVLSFDAPPDPFAVELVDPDRIVRFSRRWYPPSRNRRRLFGAVRDGDWDVRPHQDAPMYDGPPPDLYLGETIESTPLYRAIEARLERDVPWDRTSFVASVVEYLEAGHFPVWGACEGREDVLDRCRALESLADSLARVGCQSAVNRWIHGLDSYDGFLDALENEIVVDVGRDGELLLVSGVHRLTIASVLDLDRVPIVFLVRHAEWMERRAALASDGAGPFVHPDLRDLGAGGELGDSAHARRRPVST